MKTKTGIVSALVLGFAAAIAFSAEAASKPIQIWVSSQADVKYYQNMVQAYQQKVDKNFNAVITAYGFAEMPTKLAIAIKSGVNPPDLVQLDEIFFSLYLKGEVPFVDLTDRLQNSPLKSGIVPQRMGLFTWKGRAYGVPQGLSSVVLWYRDDLFKENGITPSDVNTWDKFEAVGHKVNASSRKLIALDWSYLEIMLRQRGYDLFGADGKTFPDSARLAETWLRLKKWQTDSIGIIPDRAGIFDPAFFSSYVGNNGILTLIGADWYGLDLIQNMDAAHKGLWRAMPLPTWTDSLSHGRKNTSSFSGQGLMIFKKSQHVEPCWKFLEWVMSDVDANVERFTQGNCFPAYMPAWTDMRFSNKIPFFGNQDLGQLFMELSPNLPYTVQSPLHALVINALRESYFVTVVRGNSTPGEGMDMVRQSIANKLSGKNP